jgi:hypothetical protein
MPINTVLKRKQSLVGNNFLMALLKKIKAFRGERVSNLARIKNSLPTEELSGYELCNHSRELTGENDKEVLGLAGKDVNEASLRLLLHFTILLANENGQPNDRICKR